MSTHAKLSPSSSNIWSNCPASIKMSEGIEDKSNPAAELGTAVHELGEVLLTTASNGEQFIGKHFNDIEVTLKMAKDADTYADYVRSFCGGDAELLVEQKIDLTMVAPDTYGHADAVIITPTVLHTIDYKNGRGLVMPENNSQLMLYALGAYYEHEMFNDFEEITLHVVQPNASTGGHCSAWTCSVEKLLEFGEWISARAKEALEGDGECNAGSHCTWCRARNNCKALLDFTTKAVTGEFDDLDEVEVHDERVTLEQVAHLLKNKKLIESLIKAYEERALTELQAGNGIDGFKLVESKKNKAWVNSSKALDKLKTWFPIDEITTRKICTPTQAAKMLDTNISTRKLNIFNALWAIPEGVPTIAPETDKRKAIQPIVDGFEEL